MNTLDYIWSLNFHSEKGQVVKSMIAKKVTPGQNIKYLKKYKNKLCRYINSNNKEHL